MKVSWKSLLFTWLLPLAVLVAVGAWAIGKFDWRLVVEQLRGASIPMELAMAAAWVGSLFLRPIRMLVLLGAMAPGVKRSYAAVWSADVIAMAMNSVIPMRAGDMMIAFMLRQRLGVRLTRGTSIVLVDRFFDFATVIVLFVVMLAAAPTVVPWAHDVSVSLAVALVLLVAGLLGVIRTARLWSRLLERTRAPLPGERADRWRRLAQDLLEGFAAIDRVGIIAAVIVVSILMWSSIAASYWFGVRAMWPHMTIPAAAFAASAVALSFVVPLAPGGFGVFHGAAVLALSLFAIPAEPALAFAIVAHGFQMGSVLVLGTASLLWQGISIRGLIAAREAQP
jgi:glycosyltransferase 2 family protein